MSELFKGPMAVGGIPNRFILVCRHYSESGLRVVLMSKNKVRIILLTPQTRSTPNMNVLWFFEAHIFGFWNCHIVLCANQHESSTCSRYEHERVPANRKQDAPTGNFLSISNLLRLVEAGSFVLAIRPLECRQFGGGVKGVGIGVDVSLAFFSGSVSVWSCASKPCDLNHRHQHYHGLSDHVS